VNSQDKLVSVLLEYFYEWDKCRGLRAKLRALRCEMRDSETLACHNDDTVPEESWCAKCVEGKKVFEELKQANPRAKLKLAAVRRCAKKIARVNAIS
jgi:thiol-disulfide isomerase/thioredoxin